VTFDLDVFVILPPTAGPLLTLSPLYEALRAKGYDVSARSQMPYWRRL
jgi:hypothetical protein